MTVCKVVSNAVVEQDNVLANEANIVAQAIQREITDGYIVDQNIARIEFIKPRQQTGKRRFSAAGVTHYGERFSGSNVNAHTVDNGLIVVAVGKANILKTNSAFNTLYFCCALIVFILLVHDHEQAVRAGNAALKRRV